MSILLVDDDVELCRLIEEYLTSHGFTVHCVHDGAAGLSRVFGHPYALVILDVMLPFLDGFEVLQQLRRRSNVPVILLTARTCQQDRIRGFDVGADDYLTKPFDPDELRARIHVGQRTLGLMANIKRLTGLLPICGYCKRIRSEHDYWEQVESYISQHTDAVFSHGICPACLEKAMAELAPV